MYGVIPAGGAMRPHDPLWVYSQGQPKALIDIAGRPMLQRVLDGLHEAHTVEQIVVVGLDEAHRTALEPAPDLHFLPEQGGLLANVLAGLHWVRQRAPHTAAALLCAADVPHIRGPMIDELVALCQPLDHPLYYTVATPQLIEARYPHAQRTYTRLREARIAGGDILVAQLALLDGDLSFLEAFTRARKRPWRLAQLVGWSTLLKLLTRRLTLDEVATLGGRLLGSDKPIKIVLAPYAELAMDGDKPQQIDLLRYTLMNR